MKKQEVIAKVNECISSIFTKEDVIKLIEQVEDEDKAIDEQMFEDILRTFKQKLDRVENDGIVDYSSAEFNIGYDNRLELDCISVDIDKITDQLEEVFKEYRIDC